MAQALNYSYNSVAQEVICAEDAISSLPAALDRLGGTRAMVICGPSILEKSGVEMIGATSDAIDKAEDRERFRDLHKPADRIDVFRPQWPLNADPVCDVHIDHAGRIGIIGRKVRINDGEVQVALV
ncbi:MAG: hypothetical protein IIB89_10920, partial [Chloroflexi bacterium]|nr:hypothetical protein [Chloroflexota bacterium]